MRSAYLTKSISAATVRALNYTPSSTTLRQKVDEGNGTTVGALFTIGASYHSIFKQLDCSLSQGEEILTQIDIFSTEPSGRIVRRDLITDLEARRIHRGMILIAGAGQMEETNLFGRAIIGDERLAGKLVSSHVVTLSAREDPFGDQALYSYAFLCSRSGIGLLRACAMVLRFLECASI